MALQEVVLAKGITPETFSKLELDLDLACLQYYVLHHHVVWSEDPYLLLPDDSHGLRMTGAGAERVFRGYGVAQALDGTAQEELAWEGPVKQAMANICRMPGVDTSLLGVKAATSLYFTPRHQSSRRADYHVAMHRQRTIDGERIINPFGPDYARDMALGRVVLPHEVAPVTPEDVTRLAGDHALKRELLNRLLTQGHI